MRVLIAGDVLGRLKQLFSRVQGIQRKNGPFEMLLCVGSFFSNTPSCVSEWSDYKDGRDTVPIATYILGPSSLEQVSFYDGVGAEGGEMCNNVTCLGQRGIYTTSSGLQIAYLSGCHDHSLYHKSEDGQLSHYFSVADAGIMEGYAKKDGFKGVDLFLSPEWPKGVGNLTTPPVGTDRVGSEVLSRLVMILKPRYHFAATHGKFYERPPYRNHQVLQGTQQHVTRFIALSNVGNPDKKNRYIYAFSVSPMSDMDLKELMQQPPALTNCPYVGVVKRKIPEDMPEQNFFFDPKALAAGQKRKQQQQHRGDGAPRSKKPLFSDPPAFQSQAGASSSSDPHRAPHPPAPRGPCWFCLGSASVEKHLIVSIGDHCYLALPKGGLVPEHVLVLPIGHIRASTDAPQEVLEEMIKFRSALRKYFASREQSCVIFERNFKSQHLQLQVVPVQEAPSEALRRAFIDHGKGMGLELNEVDRDTPISELAPVGSPYFTVEFDEGPSLFVRIRGRFQLQFGREVLASPVVLGMPERADWKACSATKDQESSAAKKLRDNFKPFDFTDD